MSQAHAAPVCRVRQVRLFQFRNYTDEVVALGPGLNVVAGRNAQGKTNLLEAVATAALTRSPRTGSTADLVAWGAPAARVELTLTRPDGPGLIDLRMRRSDGDRVVRTVAVDGRERPARSVLGLCPVVLFWPEDLLVVKAGPEGRRRLLDIVLSQLEPRTAVELVRYRRVLEQRNALLRQVRAGDAPVAALAGFTAEAARSGGWIQAARSRLVTALQPRAAAALDELSAGVERLQLRYRAEGDGDEVDGDPAAAASTLAARLAARAGEEVARGVTLAGPHRDDVEVAVDGRPARTAASQGQQRSIVLAWKLAEVRHVAASAGVAPVLLLDDVLSELDGRRRLRLIEGLGGGSAIQALLTTSEAALPELTAAGDACHLVVEGGRVRTAAAVR